MAVFVQPGGKCALCGEKQKKIGHDIRWIVAGQKMSLICPDSKRRWNCGSLMGIKSKYCDAWTDTQGRDDYQE